MKRRYQSFLIGLGLLLITMPSFAQSAKYPAWWITSGVVDTTKPVNNFAPVTGGQLKWMATKARVELNARIPSGAGPAVDALVNSFSKTAGNNLPMNLGQIKNVAKPFYDRLKQAGYATSYPWTDTTTDDKNTAMANQGQLKNVFKFDLSATFPSVTYPYLPYSTGFESSEGYNAALNGLLGWFASDTSCYIFGYAQSGYTTLQCVMMSANSTGSKISHGVAPVSGAAVKIACSVTTDYETGDLIPDVLPPEPASAVVSYDTRLGFIALDGNGTGGGTWVTAPNTRLKARPWCNIRAEIDYTQKMWKLYVYDQTTPVLTGLHFKDNSVTELKRFSVRKTHLATWIAVDNVNIQK